VERLTRQHIAHGDDKDWQAQGGSNPKASPHVDMFWVGFVLRRDRPWFQRHAALRANAGAITNNLRVHRTRVGGGTGVC